jgi:uncharacterized caspase-like protein
MNKPIDYFLRSILLLLLLMLFTACATNMPVETPQEVVFFPDSAEPLVQAKLGKVRISPITREIDYLASSDYQIAETEFKNRLHTLLGSRGLFGTSTEDFIDVTAEPLSFDDKDASVFRVLIEFTVKYEFRTDEGTLLIEEKITSRGTQPGRHQVSGSISNAVSANVAKLSHAIKKELPNAWQSYVEKREAVRRLIATSLKNENRYFRVISAEAIVRSMPETGTKEVTSLHQSDLVHVTGSLPSGWLQVSREGEPIGWVHSSLLREDFAAAPSYRPLETSKVSSPAIPPPGASIPVDIKSLDFGSYHALIVGNNEYRHLPKLRTAINDAKAMAGLLQDKYGFRVQLLINATRADILRALNGYRRNLSSRDNLLIYYAGHGWLDKDADEGYWLPVDAAEQDSTNWVSNSSISGALRAIQAKHVLVVADTCYSGKLARGINVRLRTSNYYEQIARKKARTVMASGGLEPVADDGGKGEHSVFAFALIKVLSENQGVLDATLLFSKIRRPVMVNADQTPEYSDIRKAGHDGGDFLFVPR